jgi:hypothetical protein
MRGNEVTVASSAWNGNRRNEPERREPTTYRRSGRLAVVSAAAALALAACSTGSSTPRVASLNQHNSNSSGSGQSGGTATAGAPKGDATTLVDEWAACERSHGDPSQADPVIDTHGVININLPGPGQGGTPAGDPHDATGTCSQYLAAAQIALRKADPVQDPLGVTSTAVLVNFSKCMRANGVPNYPFPYGPNDSKLNFQGTGVDPGSPSVVRVNDLCGKKLGLPAWWINGWGPPGDISVGTAGGPGPSGPNRPRRSGNSGAGGNSGSSTGG